MGKNFLINKPPKGVISRIKSSNPNMFLHLGVLGRCGLARPVNFIIKFCWCDVISKSKEKKTRFFGKLGYWWLMKNKGIFELLNLNPPYCPWSEYPGIKVQKQQKFFWHISYWAFGKFKAFWEFVNWYSPGALI